MSRLCTGVPEDVSPVGNWSEMNSRTYSEGFGPHPLSWINSLLIHLFILAAVLLPIQLGKFFGGSQLPHRVTGFTRYIPLTLTFPHLRGSGDRSSGGGGSGNHSPLPSSQGSLPPFARTQFAPAMLEVPKVPALPMPATLLGPPELTLPPMKLNMPWGDPASAATVPSSGPGAGGSFGNGDGTGIRNGKGPGYGPGSNGGCCDGDFQVGVNGVTAPIPIYSPDPAYSEEARKAKFTGMVILWIVVDAQGTVRNLQVARHLGMGLDEAALKTVSSWKFKPAMNHGVPVSVPVQVEVSFRLF